MPGTLTYKEKIRHLSLRLVEAQRPIRVLDSIKWPVGVSEKLRQSKYRDIPEVSPQDYLDKCPLEFNPDEKDEELRVLGEDIQRDLGVEDAIGQLLVKTSEEYRDVIQMLKHRGTPLFGELSKKLYGSSQDRIHGDERSVSELGTTMYEMLSKLQVQKLALDHRVEENIPAEKVVQILNERFEIYFGSSAIRAKLSDGIVADAAAGGDSVKIRSDTLFSAQDVDLLEVHEGWVHVGTTQNGNAQSVAKWLSKGPPRVASTQEGLAVIMEIFTFRSFPRRAKTINDRILAVNKAESGANVVELIEFFRTEGYSEEESVRNTKRIFRGAPLTGGPCFTKDLSYCRGFIENYNFMRSAIRAGKSELLPFLFAGKMHVDDVPLLYQKSLEGIVDPPQFLPPQFKDLSGLAVWMSFSNFLNSVNMKKVQGYYDQLFNHHL